VGGKWFYFSRGIVAKPLLCFGFVVQLGPVVQSDPEEKNEVQVFRGQGE